MPILLLLSFLLVPSLVLAEDIYVAQNTAGFNDGLSCANAHAATWFNTAGNWGAGTGKISAGDFAHLCGTITSTLTAQSSGSVGNPITIDFETGAKISKAVCYPRCLDISGRSYIIVDGGTNGIIESTANGTSPTYANQSGAVGIYAKGSSNYEIKNLTIRNMYVHLFNLADNVVSYSVVNAISFDGSNVHIHNNIMHDAGWALNQGWQNGDTNVEIDHNEIYNSSHGWTVGGAGAASASNFKFYNNHVHSFSNWDTTQNTYHHDGVHAFSINGAVANAYDIYNNLFEGPCGDHMTGLIYMEGNAGTKWTNTGTVRIFNNVLRCDSLVYGLAQVQAGHGEIYNNTIIGLGAPSGSDLDGTCLVVNNSSNALIKNNAISGCRFLISINDVTTIANPATDLNFNTYGSCGTSNCFSWTGVSPFTLLLTTWQANCRCDGNSTKNANLLLDSTWHPTAGSPVIGTGTNLSSLSISDLNRDIMLIPRPSIGPWTVGAYNFASDTVSPATPANLTVQ
jgi:hypothetical protein